MSAPGTRPILVVDDDPDIREAIALALESCGFYVVTAAGGADCMELLRADHSTPALILLDLMMPSMNGWEVCEAIAADPRLARLPVVVLTGNTRVADYDLPIAGFLRKPVDLETLVAVVEQKLLDE